MQFTALGPVTAVGSFGSQPPMLMSEPLLAHGPLDRLAAPRCRLPMNQDWLRPAHSAIRNVMELPSVISENRWRAGTSVTAPTTLLCPITPMKFGSLFSIALQTCAFK